MTEHIRSIQEGALQPEATPSGSPPKSSAGRKDIPLKGEGGCRIGTVTEVNPDDSFDWMTEGLLAPFFLNSLAH